MAEPGVGFLEMVCANGTLAKCECAMLVVLVGGGVRIAVGVGVWRGGLRAEYLSSAMCVYMSVWGFMEVYSV